MSEKNQNQFNGFVPFQGMVPMMPVVPVLPIMPFAQNPNGWGYTGRKKNAESETAWLNDCQTNMKTMYDQMIDMQKSTTDASRDQWNQLFEHLMDMEETFINSLPDEVPTVPGLPPLPISPKEFMGRIKEFQKMSNDHIVEQTDSAVDFYLKGQEKVGDIVNTAMENRIKDLEKASQAAAEEKPAKAEKAEKAEKESAKEDKAAEEPAKAAPVKAATRNGSKSAPARAARGGSKTAPVKAATKAEEPKAETEKTEETKDAESNQ